MEILTYLANRESNWTTDCSYLESLAISEDLSHPDRDMVLLWCKRNNLYHCEVSAATGYGISNAIHQLISLATTTKSTTTTTNNNTDSNNNFNTKIEQEQKAEEQKQQQKQQQQQQQQQQQHMEQQQQIMIQRGIAMQQQHHHHHQQQYLQPCKTSYGTATILAETKSNGAGPLTNSTFQNNTTITATAATTTATADTDDFSYDSFNTRNPTNKFATSNAEQQQQQQQQQQEQQQHKVSLNDNLHLQYYNKSTKGTETSNDCCFWFNPSKWLNFFYSSSNRQRSFTTF
jgi:hypothetical protein